MRRLLVLIVLLTNACAIGDPGQNQPVSTNSVESTVPQLPTEPPTPQVPLTLPAVPAVQYTGLCADTRPLENWLQISTRLVSDFQTALTSATGLPATLVYDITINMAAIRDAAAAIPTPDCTAAAQIIMMDTFNRAIPPFQAYSNGENVDLSPVITEVNDLLEVVKTQQNQLLEQLIAQFANR